MTPWLPLNRKVLVELDGQTEAPALAPAQIKRFPTATVGALACAALDPLVHGRGSGPALQLPALGGASSEAGSGAGARCTDGAGMLFILGHVMGLAYGLRWITASSYYRSNSIPARSLPSG